MINTSDFLKFKDTTYPFMITNQFPISFITYDDILNDMDVIVKDCHDIDMYKENLEFLALLFEDAILMNQYAVWMNSKIKNKGDFVSADSLLQINSLDTYEEDCNNTFTVSLDDKDLNYKNYELFKEFAFDIASITHKEEPLIRGYESKPNCFTELRSYVSKNLGEILYIYRVFQDNSFQIFIDMKYLTETK